jgi:DNA-binding transcriptional MocR family regulator
MTEIKSSEYFAIVPQYVLFSQVSANAVRLFAVLNRYANAQQKAWPSRKTLAQLMEVSVATVDRAKDELVELGALQVENRQGPNGDPTSNIYTLVMSSPMRRGTPTGEERGTPTGDALNRVNMKQSQLAKSSPAKTCNECLAKYRLGHEDGTEGLSHIWEPDSRTFVVCPSCDGEGTR